MNAPLEFPSLAEFYDFYLTEHARPLNRVLHFCGTALVIACLVLAAAFAKWWLLLLMPVCGYAFAWIGHFGFEKNRPATFKHPFYSLACDFIMSWHILTGQIT